MRFNEVSASVDNGLILTFKMSFSEGKNAEGIISAIQDFNPDDDYDFSFRRTPKRRSINANAYMWILCDKIAGITKGTKEEVYRKAIREVGAFSDVAVQEGEPCRALVRAWSGNGIGYFAEAFKSGLKDKDGRPMRRVRMYEGSHMYDTKQMSRLIDYIVDEAKNLGIETMTPSQVEELKASWQG